MKILRTAEEVIQAKENERIANIGCYECPDCKTKLSELSHYKETWYENDNGKMITKHCDWFKCLNCGAIWQSEEYQGVCDFVFSRRHNE